MGPKPRTQVCTTCPACAVGRVRLVYKVELSVYVPEEQYKKHLDDEAKQENFEHICEEALEAPLKVITEHVKGALKLELPAELADAVTVTVRP